MKKVISSSSASCLDQLREAIWRMQAQAKLAAEASGNSIRGIGERIYVTLNSDSLRLTLVEEVLTDGSKVYNIEFSEVSK